MLTNDELQALNTFFVRDNHAVKAVGVWEAIKGMGNTNTSYREDTAFYALEEWAGQDFPVLTLGAGLPKPRDQGVIVRILAVVEDVIYIKFLHSGNIQAIPLGQRHSVDRGIAYDTVWYYSIWGVTKKNLEKKQYRHPQSPKLPKADVGPETTLQLQLLTSADEQTEK